MLWRSLRARPEVLRLLPGPGARASEESSSGKNCFGKGGFLEAWGGEGGCFEDRSPAGGEGGGEERGSGKKGSPQNGCEAAQET